MSLVVFSLALLIPITPHTPAEQRVWEEAWEKKVEANGILSRSLLAEYVDFQTRHAPRVSSASTTRSTYKEMGSGVEQWRGLVSKYFTDVNKVLCLMGYESGGNPNATSYAGARGLLQVMPFWAESLGISPNSLYDPATNIKVAKYVYDQQGWNAWDPYKRGECR